MHQVCIGRLTTHTSSLAPDNKSNPAPPQIPTPHTPHSYSTASSQATTSPLLGMTDPASRISTDKRPIPCKKPSPGPPVKSRKGTHPPLGLCKGSPLLWDPITQNPVIPSHHCQATPCQPGSMSMQISSPCQHGSLTSRQEPILKPPGMHPELLPVEVTNLQHAILRKEWICMKLASLLRHQTCKMFLIPKEGLSQGHIPRPLKVPPHHQAVLKVLEH